MPANDINIQRVKDVIQAEVLFQEGKQLMSEGKPEEARQKFQDAYDINPEPEYSEHIKLATLH